jgi:REP-associated tyrosine transposase
MLALIATHKLTSECLRLLQCVLLMVNGLTKLGSWKMTRPLRVEFAGALYHITSRGNDRQTIYKDDDDRDRFLRYLAKTCDRYHWLCHAYCLMSNHYHLLIETQTPTLSKGMKYINGGYTQSFNRRHSRVGHVFQGRFKGILVEAQSYLLELSRYIVLNPVRAKMVASAGDWSWSSYRATAGILGAPAFLTTIWILSLFGCGKKRAQEKYKEFVQQGLGNASPWESLKNQIYLGSDQFVEDMQVKICSEQSLDEIPSVQKLAPMKPLSYYGKKSSNKVEAMAAAYRSGHYTLKIVGVYFGVSYTTVSRAVKTCEERGVKCKT